MTDEEHAHTIREHVDALNRAIREAVEAGLYCELAYRDVTEMQHPERVYMVSVSVERRTRL